MNNRKNISDYICFDLETTGFGNNAKIIEIGAIKVRNGEVTEIFSELVNPLCHIPQEITEITGISQKDVENCRSISEVLSDFLEFVDDDVLVGHNIASFDIPIIRRTAAVELGRKFDVYYIDTMHISRQIKGVPDHKLQTMLDYYGIQNDRAHRAFEDCEANNKLLNALIYDGADVSPSYSCGETDISQIQKTAPKPKEHLDFSMSEEKLSSVAGKRIVLTGDFEFGSRNEVEHILSSEGAFLRNTVGKNTDYLIVGGYGSSAWVFENGGRKLQEAHRLGIEILPESSIKDILIRYAEVYNG